MKINKHIAILLTMLILVSNVGLAFNVHYCGDKIASVSFVSLKDASEKDCCGKAEKKSPCCKDKKIKLEKKADNSVVKTFSFQLEIPFASFDWKPVACLDSVCFKSNQITAFYCNSNAPPLYKLYSQYLFYA
ncbi:HYC_CC_PP family protein [Flavobacterium sp.]|uniref:HYC_CC_PP family protein n=1 Tax=Flavobacterium sp. TaxID=239 RepID=UPI003D6AEF03